MAISRRQPRGHECLRLGAHINSYEFPRAMHPTSQHAHKLVATASQCTTSNQSNRSIYPGTKPGHAEPTTEHSAWTPRLPCGNHLVQEHTAVNKVPGGSTAAPAAQRAHYTYMPSNASLNSATARPSLRESHDYHHTRALPAPEGP